MEKKTSFDRTQILGLVMIGAILIVFSYFNQGGQENIPASPAQEETQPVQPEALSADTTSTIAVEQSTAPATVAHEEEFFTLENDLVQIRVSNHGAQMVEARLKNYQTYDSLPLYLFKNNQSMNFAFGGWNSDDAWYTPVERTATSLALQAEGPDGAFIIRWKLNPGDYRAEMSVSGVSPTRVPLRLDWAQTALRHEKSLDNEARNTSTYFWEIEENDYDDLSAGKEDSDEAANLLWIAHKQQFFSAILTAETRFDEAKMAIIPLEGEGATKQMATEVHMQNVEGNFTVPFSLYLGPNKYEILKTYNLGYDKLIPFGWGIFGWISRGVVVQLFNWLDGYGLNYGIIILLMTLMIKLALFPLTYTSYRSMAKMRVLKPEIDEINEEYKDQDPVKKQQAVMALYRKVGVNPIGGCIPQLLQMPILLSMFYFFPASIELRQQAFLWADDLSSYDSIASIPNIPFYGDHISLFTILMAVSMFMYTYMNQQMSGTNSQMPQLKWIMYLMPVMLLVWFNSYASGLSYYYLLSNLITFGQMFVIRAFIDEDAIHAKLQANKEKPKKRSKLQARMDRALEQQRDGQAMNRQMRRQHKK